MDRPTDRGWGSEIDAARYFARFIDLRLLAKLTAFACLVSAMGVAIPLVFMSRMDGQPPTTADYWALTGAFLLFGVIMLCVRGLALRLALDFFHRVRAHVFEKALYGARGFGRGMVISRLTFNLGFVRQALENLFTVLGPGLALLLAGIPVTLYLFPWTAPYLLVYLLMMALYAWFCLGIQRRYILQLHTSNSMLTTFVDDMVSGRTLGNDFIRHPIYLQRFEKLSRRDIRIRFKRNLFYLVNQVFLEWIARIGHIVVLAFVLIQQDLNPIQKAVLVFLYTAVAIVPLMAMLRTVVQIAPGLICLGTLHHLLGDELGRARRIVPMLLDNMEFHEAGRDRSYSFRITRASKAVIKDPQFFEYLSDSMARGAARKKIRLNGAPLDRVRLFSPTNLALIGKRATMNYGTLYQNIFLEENGPVRTAVINRVFDQAERLCLHRVLSESRGLSMLCEPSSTRLDFSEVVKMWLLRCTFSEFDFVVIDDIWSQMSTADAELCQDYLHEVLAECSQLLVFSKSVPRCFGDYRLIAPAHVSLPAA